MSAPIPQIVRLRPIGSVRAGAARQGVVSVLEDGLRNLPPPLDRAVQTLVPADRRDRVETESTYYLQQQGELEGEGNWL